MDIVEFLRARLDEDEELARDAHYVGQVWVPEEEAVVAADRDLDPLLFLDRKRDAQHAAHWSPERVLREVEAKRRIVGEHGGTPPYHVDPCDAHDATFATVPCETVLALASVYADHPDYDPDWAVG